MHYDQSQKVLSLNNNNKVTLGGGDASVMLKANYVDQSKLI